MTHSTLFGMLKLCFSERPTGEPDEQVIRDLEGWILGRKSRPSGLDVKEPGPLASDCRVAI